MPHAILTYFDPDTENAIRSVWKELANTGIAPYLYLSANRPHIKLAIFEQLDLAGCETRLRAIARSTPALPLKFRLVGIFPNASPTVCLAPVTSQELFALQARVDKELGGLGLLPPYDFFQPGLWQPHCLLGMDLPPEKLDAALRAAMRLELPLDGEIQELGVIEFHPVKHCLALKLEGE